MERLPRAMSSLTLGLCMCLTIGCADPNVLSTPRTVPVGDAAFTASTNIESFSAVPTRAPPLLDPPKVGWNPIALGLRTGLASRVDVGGRVGAASLGIDVKYNFLRSHAFDMAAGLGAQAYWTPLIGGGTSYVPGAPSWPWGRLMLTLPIVSGINLGERVTVVPIVGPACLTAFGGERTWITYARAGLGLSLRPTERFAIHPEVNALQSIGEERSHMLVTGAIGFTFGAVH